MIRFGGRAARRIPHEGEGWRETGLWADPRQCGTYGWDQQTGAPTLKMFAVAVQVWALLQDQHLVSIADAAAAFKVPPERIAEAVAHHGWMFVVGDRSDAFTDQFISHEGA